MFKAGELTAYKKEELKDFPWNTEYAGYYLSDIAAIISLLPKDPCDVLDLGCGPGITSHFYALRGHRVVGIDVNTECLALAPGKHLNTELRPAFVRHDYEERFCKELFDAAVFHDSLHHAMYPEAALMTAFEALKPGGICIVSEPGVGHSWSQFAQKFARDNNVTERSTPPYKVWRLGKRIGFELVAVYPHFGTLHKTMFRTEQVPGLLRRIAHSLRFSVLSLLLGKWLHGVTVLRKP